MLTSEPKAAATLWHAQTGGCLTLPAGAGISPFFILTCLSHSFIAVSAFPSCPALCSRAYPHAVLGLGVSVRMRLAMWRLVEAQAASILNLIVASHDACLA